MKCQIASIYIDAFKSNANDTCINECKHTWMYVCTLCDDEAKFQKLNNKIKSNLIVVFARTPQSIFLFF